MPLLSLLGSVADPHLYIRRIRIRDPKNVHVDPDPNPDPYPRGQTLKKKKLCQNMQLNL